MSLFAALDQFCNGLRCVYSEPPTVDFGKSAVVLESAQEIYSTFRGCTWTAEVRLGPLHVEKRFRAIVEFGGGTYDTAARLLAKRFRAKVLTGPIPIPASGVRRVRGQEFDARPTSPEAA